MSNSRPLLALLATLSCTVLPLPATAAEPTARELVKRSAAARSLPGFRAAATLTVLDGGERKVRELTWWRRAEEGGVVKMVVLFRAPENIRGEALLVIERPGAPLDGWIHLPRLKKTRHLDPSLLGASLGVTTFSFLDVALPQGGPRDARLLRKEPCPGEASARCHVVASTFEAGPCAKLTEWLHPAHFLPLRVDCAGPDGSLLRRTTLGGFRALAVKGRTITTPRWIRVEEPGSNRSAQLDVTDGRPDDAPASLFTPEGLAAPPP